jgi:hypothetical protein
VIIDSPYIIELARGVERRVLEENDAQLLLPSSVQPTVDLISPVTLFGIATGSPANQSAMANANITRTNLGGFSSNLLQLQPGLYDVDVLLSVRFNFTTIGAASPDVQLRLMSIDGQRSQILISIYAAVGYNTERIHRFRFLIQESLFAQLVLGATGVGQTMDVTCAVNAQRQL